MEDDDSKLTRSALIAAGLVLGGLFALWYWLAIVPQVQPAQVAQVAATEAPSLRLHTPTPESGVVLPDREYKAQVVNQMETILFEINVLNTGVHLADYRDPAWQTMMTDSAASLQRACDNLLALDPPVHLVAVHDNVRKSADHFRLGARILLRDSGRINGQSIDAVAVQFGLGADDLDLVADYFDR